MELDALWSETLDHLQRGAVDRKSPWHTMQVGSLSSNDEVEIRTVVFRLFKRNPVRIYFHTDLRSLKCAQFKAHPKSVSLHWYNPGRKKQIRMKGQVLIHDSGELYDRELGKVSEVTARTYSGPFAPGTELPQHHPNSSTDSDTHDLTSKNFGVIEVLPREVEVLHLKAEGHVRFRAWLAEGILTKLSWLAP